MRSSVAGSWCSSLIATSHSAAGAVEVGVSDAAGIDGVGSEGAGADSAPRPSSVVPSMTITVPQRLQVMRAFFPRTRSSGTAYLAGQAVQETFMRARGGLSDK